MIGTSARSAGLVVRAAATVQAIHDNNYYLPIWEAVKHKKPLNECSESELLEPFQRMWENLPDSQAIRRPPFSAICDLAEEFCFGTHPNKEAAQRTFDQTVKNAASRGAHVHIVGGLKPE